MKPIKFRKLTLRQITRIGLLVTLSVATLVAVLVYARTMMLSDRLLHTVEQAQVAVALSNSIHHDLEESGAYLIEHVLSGTPESRTELLHHLGLMEEKLKFLNSQRLPEELVTLTERLSRGILEIKELLQELHPAGESAVPSFNQDFVRERVRPLLMELNNTNNELDRAVWDVKEILFAEIMATARRDALWLVFMILGGALSVVLFNAWLNRHILRRIREVIAAMQGIASGTGQLSYRLDANGHDEMAELARGFNRFADKIQHVIHLVMESSSVLAKEAAVMSETSRKTKEGAERQKGEIEDIASAVSDMTQSVETVAQSAAAAADATEHASGGAGNGRETVEHTIAAIESLSDDIHLAADSIQHLVRESKNIDSVLVVINEIADQTNLLALNAAIEAARAGEQGRGFAVVADEVRSLAIRTQEGTQDIKQKIDQFRSCAVEVARLMNQGRDKAQEVVQQAALAGEALRAIHDSVATITEMTRNIARATDQQSSVVGEIRQNIVSISRIASETSEKAVQTSASNHELSLMAMQLRTLVEQFLLENGPGPADPATGTHGLEAKGDKTTDGGIAAGGDGSQPPAPKAPGLTGAGPAPAGGAGGEVTLF